MLDSYHLRANQAGGGARVACAAYVAHVAARHRAGDGAPFVRRGPCGGLPAMQFNFDMASNHVAVALWQALGFAIVGRPPRALYHPLPGPVDALVMHRWLVDPAAARNA